MLNEVLARFGLNSNEQQVLTFLLFHGSSPASRVAKLLKIKRPSIYLALENLIELGLVYKESKSRTTFFTNIPIESIPKLLENKAKKEFEDAKSATEALSGLLKQIPIRERFKFAGFQISTIESAEAVYRHLEEILNRGSFSAVFDPQLIPQGQIDTVVKNFLTNTAKTKPHIREIAIKGPVTTWYKKAIKNPNHKVKEVDKGQLILSDIIIADGELLISNYQQGSELSLRIREPNFFQTILTVFNALWKTLE